MARMVCPSIISFRVCVTSQITMILQMFVKSFFTAFLVTQFSCHRQRTWLLRQCDLLVQRSLLELRMQRQEARTGFDKCGWAIVQVRTARWYLQFLTKTAWAKFDTDQIKWIWPSVNASHGRSVRHTLHNSTWLRLCSMDELSKPSTRN